MLKLRENTHMNDSNKKTSLLSHATPIARHTLRTAYWQVAKTVHPDRVQSELSQEAMTVLNEAYRQAVLMFSDDLRGPDDVIRLDALGLEYLPIH